MTKRFNSIWPPPTYIAQFADGSEMRLSFWSRVGKPLDYEAGRRFCCAVRGRELEAKTPDDPGYFESIEYRRVLRHYAQRLIDSVVTELCGSPMPIAYKTVPVYLNGVHLRDHRTRKLCFKTISLGYDSVPLFRTFLPAIPPATDIIDGWVEKGDETFPDPFFAPAPAEPVQLRPKRKVQSDLDKALALLARLSAGDRALLQERMAA